MARLVFRLIVFEAIVGVAVSDAFGCPLDPPQHGRIITAPAVVALPGTWG